MQGVPFDRIRKFSKKSRIVPKKTKQKNETKKTFGLASIFGSIKICGLVRESNPQSPASQKISSKFNRTHKIIILENLTMTKIVKRRTLWAFFKNLCGM